MKCPVCELDLQVTSRDGVEIDFCNRCRGVWLDRGELDKLIERSTVYADQRGRDDDDDDDDDYRGRSRSRAGDSELRRRRGGFLSNFFDFD